MAKNETTITGPTDPAAKLREDNAQLKREVEDLKRRANEHEREQIRRDAHAAGYREAVRDMGQRAQGMMDPMTALWLRGRGGY